MPLGHQFSRDEIARFKQPQTITGSVQAPDLDMFRYTALQAMNDLATEWRHNGQGMLQAYLFEGMGTEARIHIWHPDLRSEGIVSNGLEHDHRFHMRSTVLTGMIAHMEYSLEDTVEEVGAVRITEVLNARKARDQTPGDRYHKDPEALPGLVRMNQHLHMIHEGEWYEFPRFRYHKAVATGDNDGLCVTLVHKSNQADVKARVVDAFHEGVMVNSFENTLSRPDFAPYIDQARKLLLSKLKG